MFLLHPQIEPWLVRTDAGCKLTLLAERGENMDVLLRCEPDNEALLVTMQYRGRVGELHRFEAELPWDSGNEPTVYCFLVIEQGRQQWLAADGTQARLPHRDVMFRVNRTNTPPAWVREQVFYQIFPDRFCQGDPALAVKSGEYMVGSRHRKVVAKHWGALPESAQGGIEFYGGDLIGVRRQVDYLQRELGVTALYLNPVFTAPSNHKYDTEDYYHVDPHLGGNEALAALATDLRERGMKLILDAVVNHTGTEHPWFNLQRSHDTLGAANSPDSPWRSWYCFDTAGQYQGWKGHMHLPVLDYRAPGLRERVYAGPNAILRHWMREPYRIDGWRFDVIHMLGEGSGSTNNAHYVREFRRAMREENPQSYVMGEHFSEATRWLQGDQEDGAMNYYGFAHPLREWLAGVDMAALPAQLDTRDFAAWLDSARARIPYDNQLAQFNLLDSHDTPRFFSLVGGDEAAMKLAVTLLFAYPGAPCIYYGDEIGLEGGADPDCRRCFDWDRSHWNRELFDHYRALIALRRERVEWRHGGTLGLAAEGDAYAFARFTDAAASVVVLNRGSEPCTLRIPVWQVPVVVKAWHAASEHTLIADPGWVTLTLSGQSSVVLLGRG
ncbi:MAG TPA: maltodextrin glucosidase [Albitalea sp.]|nr:maltodextrin glucosidase [Albitalea sp.]